MDYTKEPEFENKTTAIPADDLLRWQVLKMRDTCLFNIREKYLFHKIRKVETDPTYKSHITTLFLSLKPALRRTLKPDEFDKLQTKLKGNDSDYIDAFDIINAWLDERQITRLDRFKSYDSTNFESENREKGL